MRRDSWRSVPIMCKPPACFTMLWRSCHAALIASICSGVGFSSLSTSAFQLPPNTISVPRPAMLVAIVTAPGYPAFATISASCAWNLAFNTLCLMPALVNALESNSDFSMEIVPTNTGCLRATQSLMSSIMALNLYSSVSNITSVRSSRIIGRLVGITTVSKP